MLVNNIEELRSAIANNETEIVLAESGDFVDESDKFDESQLVSLTKKDGITIRSEDASDPETLVGLKINNAKNIQIKDVKLTGWIQEDPTQKEIAAAGQVENNSNNVTFSNVIFEGRDDSALKRVGFRAKYSSNVTVENSQFSGFRKAFVGAVSSDLRVTGNEFVNAGVDAMFFNNPKYLTIENNVVRDFDSEIRNSIDLVKEPEADHGDAIQFLVQNDFEAKDISIKNNVALIGDGADFQGIFIQTRNNGSLANVDIENNLIHTRLANGIYLGKGKNINIQDNTVVFRDSEATDSNTDKSAIIVDNAENPVIENNIAGYFKINGERFGGGGSNFAKKPTNGNIAANFKSFGADVSYEDVFVNGDMLTNPDFYSTISTDGFTVLDSISAGANLGQLPDATAGDPIDSVSEGSGGTEPSPDPESDSILISLGDANANGDIFGTAEADLMEANANTSDDKLRALGRDGNDTLIGANNVDISGENGDDLLVLNGGDSLVWGGSGSDEFRITSKTESGSNILDFEKGIDTIEFRDVQGISSMSDLDIIPLNRTYTADSLINFGDEQIRVKDMMVEDFSAEDFKFL